MTLQIIGFEKTINEFKRMAKNIDKNSQMALQKAGTMGAKFAREIVPSETGRTKEAILNFPLSGELWIIESNPPADHPDFPLNVYLEQSASSALNWGDRRFPKSGRFGFMEKTARLLDEVFTKEMNIAVEKSLKG